MVFFFYYLVVFNVVERKRKKIKKKKRESWLIQHVLPPLRCADSRQSGVLQVGAPDVDMIGLAFMT